MAQQQQQKKKRTFKQKKQFFKQKQAAQKGTGVYVDFDEVPKDLGEDEIEELFDALPKTRKKKLLPRLRPGAGHEPARAPRARRGGGHRGLPGPQPPRRAVGAASGWMARREAIVAEGVLDVQTGGHHWLRVLANDYMPALDDVYVPASLVEEHQLQRGMVVRGQVRPPGEGERYLCIHEIEAVDGQEPEEVKGRAPFKELVPIYPDDRIILEGTAENPLEMRIVDLITPIGLGQRGLIGAAADGQDGAAAHARQVDRALQAGREADHPARRRTSRGGHRLHPLHRGAERRGRLLDVRRTRRPPHPGGRDGDGEVQAPGRGRRGRDRAPGLDPRLARAANIEALSNGKLLSGGLEATALTFPKRFFGAARNIEHGGSLTILGTALIETGSKMDEVIFEEFKGTGNMEIVLDRRLSDRRIFPAIDINRSGTRKEELLFTPEEIERVYVLRRVLNELDPVEAMEMLISKMSKTSVNAEFLMTVGG